MPSCTVTRTWPNRFFTVLIASPGLDARTFPIHLHWQFPSRQTANRYDLTLLLFMGFRDHEQIVKRHFAGLHDADDRIPRQTSGPLQEAVDGVVLHPPSAGCGVLAAMKINQSVENLARTETMLFAHGGTVNAQVPPVNNFLDIFLDSVSER